MQNNQMKELNKEMLSKEEFEKNMQTASYEGMINDPIKHQAIGVIYGAMIILGLTIGAIMGYLFLNIIIGCILGFAIGLGLGMLSHGLIVLKK